MPKLKLKKLSAKPEETTDNWLAQHLRVKRTFMPTGFDQLDTLIDGLYPGNILVVGARPGTGKTTLSLNLVDKMRDKRHLVYPTENSRERWTEKMLSLVSGTPDKEIRQHPEGIVEKLSTHIDDIMARPLKVVSTYKPTFAQMERDLQEFQPHVWHMDYFQNTWLDEPGYRGYTQAVERYHNLAIKYNCALVLYSQLRRPSGDEGDKRPNMSMLKETGKLEEAAKTIILLYRNGSETELIVDKNRDGETGVVSMSGDFATNKMEETV